MNATSGGGSIAQCPTNLSPSTGLYTVVLALIDTMDLSYNLVASSESPFASYTDGMVNDMLKHTRGILIALIL